MYGKVVFHKKLASCILACIRLELTMYHKSFRYDDPYEFGQQTKLCIEND